MKVQLISDDGDVLAEAEAAYIKDIALSMGLANVAEYILIWIHEAESNGYK